MSESVHPKSRGGLGDDDASTEPATQVEYPWHATARTIFQAVVGFASMWGIIVEALGVDDTLPWVAASLAVTAAVTRVMALPAVNDFLARFVPWLAATPNKD